MTGDTPKNIVEKHLQSEFLAENLVEGLIKVPPRMTNAVMTFVTEQVLCWAHMKLKGRAKEFPEHARELKLLTKLNNVKPVDLGDLAEHPVHVKSYQFSPEGMGDKYDHLAPTEKVVYRVALNWATGGNPGSWWPKKMAIIIRPLAFDWMQRYPQSNNEGTISAFLEKIKEVIEHELRHAVQTIMLEPVDPKQARLNKGYTTSTPDDVKTMIPYYLSPIEFDPTIGSSAREFVEQIKMLQSYKKNVDVGKAIRKYVGIIKTSMMDEFRVAPFFMVLRKKAPRKYLVAVKKFVVEVKRLLDEPDNLTEGVEIPDTKYGYWIKPDGEFIPVDGPGGHLSTLRSLSGGVWKNYGDATSQGWVRVVSRVSVMSGTPKYRLSVSYDRGKVSARAAGSMRRLVASAPWIQFTVDVDGPDPDFKQFDDERSFMRFFNECRMHGRINEAAEIPHTDYGYWITPDGGFISVPYQSHEHYLPDGMDEYRDAYEQGCIRVMLRDEDLNITIGENSVTSRAVMSLRRLALSHEFTDFRVDVYMPVNGMYRQSKHFNSSGSFLAFVGEHRRHAPRLTELYQEDEGSTFTHDGKRYDLNELLKMLDDSESYEVPLDALDWVLEWDDADDERLAKADVTAPIIVTWWFDEDAGQHRLVVIDGLHRVKKALDKKMEFIPGHYVDNDDLAGCLVKEKVEEKIDAGAELDDWNHWDKVQNTSFDSRQHEMFDDSPYSYQGSFGQYEVATVEVEGQNYDDIYRYIVFRAGQPVAYADLKDHYSEDAEDGCYRVVGLRVDNDAQRNGIATGLYRWMVTDGYIDRLYADETQTNAAKALWSRLLNTPGVALFAEHEETGDVTPVRTAADFEEVYEYTNECVLFLTAAS